MRTEEEIKNEIAKHQKFISELDFKFDNFAGIAEADSISWINALKWVLESEEK